jgi:hypothetical protein
VLVSPPLAQGEKGFRVKKVFAPLLQKAATLFPSLALAQKSAYVA